MSEPTATEDAEDAESHEYAWRLTKRLGGDSVDLEIGDLYADFTGRQLTLLVQTIGKALIKAGTMMMESRVEDEDEDFDDDEFDE